MGINPFAKKDPEIHRVYVPETPVELHGQLFSTTNTESDIPKAYLEEHEIKAYFLWKQSVELLEKAGEDFEEAKKYLESTMNTMVNLSRGRQGMNVVTILGRPQLPKRGAQGYEESRYNPVPIKKQEMMPMQSYQDQQNY